MRLPQEKLIIRMNLGYPDARIRASESRVTADFATQYGFTTAVGRGAAEKEAGDV